MNGFRTCGFAYISIAVDQVAICGGTVNTVHELGGSIGVSHEEAGANSCALFRSKVGCYVS